MRLFCGAQDHHLQEERRWIQKSPKAKAASGMSSGRAGRRQARQQRTWKVYRKAMLCARWGYEQWISQWRQTISHETEWSFSEFFNCFNNLQFVFWIKLPALKGMKGILLYLRLNVFLSCLHIIGIRHLFRCEVSHCQFLTLNAVKIATRFILKLAGLHKKCFHWMGLLHWRFWIQWKLICTKKRPAQVHNEFYIANLKYTKIKKVVGLFRLRSEYGRNIWHE